MATGAPLLQYLFDEREHRVLIEAVLAKVCLLPAAHLELTARLEFVNRNSRCSEVLSMFLEPAWIHDVESVVATGEPFLHERQ